MNLEPTTLIDDPTDQDGHRDPPYSRSFDVFFDASGYVGGKSNAISNNPET
jgi:hypothetical protein